MVLISDDTNCIFDMHHFGNICIHSICCVTETRQEEIKANQGRN